MEDLEICLPKQDSKIGTRLTEPDRELFDELKQRYNFASDSEAGRCFMKLGMMSAIDNDPRHAAKSDTTEDFSPVTIRQLVPEEAENAVDATNEFWDQILRDEMMDIVLEDPEIHRDGVDIYK